MENSDDILNIEIDPLLLKSYAKLNLEDNSDDDFFNEFPVEISQSDDLSDFVNIPSNEDINTCKDKTNSDETSSDNISPADIKLCVAENEQPISINKSKGKSDINGNETSETGENFNNLFSNLKISNNDEEDKTSSQLIERGPDRPPKRTHKLRDQNSYSRDNIDTSQLNRERRLFLSGSTYSQLGGSVPANNIFNDGISSEPPILENLNTNSLYAGLIGNSENNFIAQRDLPVSSSDPSFYQCSVTSSSNLYCNIDSFYEDPTTKSVSSPTNSVSSGYETCSPCSVSSSPPKITLPSFEPNLDLLAETVNEQDILDFVVEYESITNRTPPADHDLGDKSYDEKILDYIDYLKDDQKDTPAATSSECVAIVNNLDVNTVYSGSTRKTSLPNNSNPPIACMPLKDAAKKKLRDSLSNDKCHAVQVEIYHRINETNQDKESKCDAVKSGVVVKRTTGKRNAVKVIYVEDEDEKTSENQTNLHLAVLNSEIEKIYCLVEIHKQFNESFLELSLRDKHGKTALDYAIEKDMTLVIDYLRESNAYPSLKI